MPASPARCSPPTEGSCDLVRAVVWTGALEVRDDVELIEVAPGPGEVLVRIERAGVCHSDLSVINGTIPFPTPVVLGHEGAGVVEAVGAGVRKVAEGDHVVLTTLGNCGQCDACDRGEPTHCRDTFGRLPRPFTVGGEKAFQFANAGVFTERVIVRDSQAVVDRQAGAVRGRVPHRLRASSRAPVRCSTAPRCARARRWWSSAWAASASPSCRRPASPPPAASSPSTPTRRRPPSPRQFGATDFIDASSVADTVAAVKDLGLPNGVDHVFECVGHPALIRQSIDLLDWGGNCVLLGVPKLGTEATFVVNSMYNDKAIMGCRYGTTRPHHDIPLLVDFYLDGRLQLDEMVSQVYDLGDIQQALDDMHDGKLNRGVLAVSTP